jgi:hypothetical protein
MNVDPTVRELLTCALLQLDPRIVDKRTVLHSVLVEIALHATSHPSSLEELSVQVDSVVNQRDFLAKQDLNYAVDDCLSRRTLIHCDGRYELSTERSEELRSIFTCAEETKGKMRHDLIESIELEIGKPLSSSEASAICESVERVLTTSVYDLSLQLARENLTLDEMLSRLESADSLSELDEVLNSHFSAERQLLRQQIRTGIRNYFKDLSPALQETLGLIHHNVLINQILNLDPSMVRLQREWFSKRRLYLDTNVVLAYIFEGQERHSVVLDLIQATLKLGVQLFISPFTLQELERQVDRARRNYFQYDRDPLVKRAAANGDDAILATYVRLHRSQPSLEWDGFVAQFEDLGDTLLAYNILVENEGVALAESSEELPRIRKEIADAKPHWVNERVVEHDSLNCALVSHLQEVYPPDERGQVVWLLTIDSSLKTAQKRLYGVNVISKPYCIQAEQWGEIVLPAQNLPGFVFKDFIGYLAQAKLGVIASSEVVQLDFLETIRDAGVDVDRLLRLDTNQVRRTLVCLQTSRDTRALATMAAETTDEPQRRDYQRQLQFVIDEAIEETDPVRLLEERYNQRINLLEQKLEERGRRIEELSTRVAKTESTWVFRVSSWISRFFRKV